MPNKRSDDLRLDLAKDRVIRFDPKGSYSDRELRVIERAHKLVAYYATRDADMDVRQLAGKMLARVWRKRWEDHGVRHNTDGFRFPFLG